MLSRPIQDGAEDCMEGLVYEKSRWLDTIC